MQRKEVSSLPTSSGKQVKEIGEWCALDGRCVKGRGRAALCGRRVRKLF